MNILVTGGAGFIGSHLCEALLRRNYNVFCLDNFNDFYDPVVKRRNLKECLENQRLFSGLSDKNGKQLNHEDLKGFTLLEGDIRDAPFLKKVFSRYRFDVVFHLAAMAGVRPSIRNPLLYYEVNVTGTLNLLERCRAENVRKIIFASSSSVYGNNKKIPFEESDPVDNPISPYAASKKAGELICHCYHHLYEMSIACLRYFTVYGARQRPDLAIHKFAKLMIAGEPIPVYGDRQTVRDYTYIDDIIDGTLKALDFLSEERRFEVFNLGESQTITLSRMIQSLEEKLGLKAIIKPYPHQEGDVQKTFASIEKSRKMLSYNPSTSFEVGMELFVKWLREKG